MRLVVDSSVAVKWFAPEPYQQAALAVLDEASELIAPDLLLVEVANALRRKIRRGEFTAEQLEAALRELGSTIILQPLTAHLIQDAVRISAELDHSVYDSTFLACAREESAGLVTADARLIAKVSGRSEWRNVRGLSPTESHAHG